MEYKEIIKKRKITSVAEDSELYYLENSKDYENTDNIEKRNKTENLSPKINNEHDKIFRKILSIKSETAKFINKTLDLTGEDAIKEEQLEKYTTRFITINLYDKESDIIYKIKGRNIFILIEHQTQNDYKMPIRMLEYSLGIIKSAIDYKKITDINYKMPSVIPIVLYTGKTKWKAKRSISEKQQTLDRKNEQKYPKYNLVDVNKLLKDGVITDIDYGYVDSYSGNDKLNISYYKHVSFYDYFKNYTEDNPNRLLFSYMNHISVVPKAGYIPKRYIHKLKRNDLKYIKSII